MSHFDQDIKDESKQKPRPSNVSINVKELMAKFRTKREVYNFLVLDCKVYLPAYDTVTIYFMREIIMGTKKGKVFLCLC